MAKHSTSTQAPLLWISDEELREKLESVSEERDLSAWSDEELRDVARALTRPQSTREDQFEKVFGRTTYKYRPRCANNFTKTFHQAWKDLAPQLHDSLHRRLSRGDRHTYETFLHERILRTENPITAISESAFKELARNPELENSDSSSFSVGYETTVFLHLLEKAESDPEAAEFITELRAQYHRDQTIPHDAAQKLFTHIRRMYKRDEAAPRDSDPLSDALNDALTHFGDVLKRYAFRFGVSETPEAREWSKKQADDDEQQQQTLERTDSLLSRIQTIREQRNLPELTPEELQQRNISVFQDVHVLTDNAPLRNAAIDVALDAKQIESEFTSLFTLDCAEYNEDGNVTFPLTNLPLHDAVGLNLGETQNQLLGESGTLVFLIDRRDDPERARAALGKDAPDSVMFTPEGDPTRASDEWLVQLYLHLTRDRGIPRDRILFLDEHCATFHADETEKRITRTEITYTNPHIRYICPQAVDELYTDNEAVEDRTAPQKIHSPEARRGFYTDGICSVGGCQHYGEPLSLYSINDNAEGRNAHNRLINRRNKEDEEGREENEESCTYYDTSFYTMDPIRELYNEAVHSMPTLCKPMEGQMLGVEAATGGERANYTPTTYSDPHNAEIGEDEDLDDLYAAALLNTWERELTDLREYVAELRESKAKLREHKEKLEEHKEKLSESKYKEKLDAYEEEQKEYEGDLSLFSFFLQKHALPPDKRAEKLASNALKEPGTPRQSPLHTHVSEQPSNSVVQKEERSVVQKEEPQKGAVVTLTFEELEKLVNEAAERAVRMFAATQAEEQRKPQGTLGARSPRPGPSKPRAPGGRQRRDRPGR